MIIPSKKLRQLIEVYPTRKLFADQAGIEESLLSEVLKGKEVTKNMMEALHHYTGWELGDLFEIVDDKAGHA